MNYLHAESCLNSGDLAVVPLDSQANVMLMDDLNYSSYRRGDSYRYFGGFAERSPIRIAAPYSGHWNVVVDLGGYAGSIRAGLLTVAKAGPGGVLRAFSIQ
ncbi:DUF1883 domain-containing protein [soil metagenome]